MLYSFLLFVTMFDVFSKNRLILKNMIIYRRSEIQEIIIWRIEVDPAITYKFLNKIMK